MKERAEQTYWLSSRGLIVTLPPEASYRIASSRNGLPLAESRRLKLIENCGILTRRYPTPADGESFMYKTEPKWREELYRKAESLATEFAREATDLGVGDIAVVLFGSIAKNLVKNRDHEDPSNIDLVVIGNFTDVTAENFKNRISGLRTFVARQIKNNVGVIVQTPEKIARNNFSDAKNKYIKSSARAIYDPSGIWAKIEEEALENDLK